VDGYLTITTGEDGLADSLRNIGPLSIGVNATPM